MNLKYDGPDHYVISYGDIDIFSHHNLDYIRLVKELIDDLHHYGLLEFSSSSLCIEKDMFLSRR